MDWTNISEAFPALPDEIELFEGKDTSIPVKAWYARINTRSRSIRMSVERAESEIGAETVSATATRLNACLAVNGGYFLNRDGVSLPIGLVVSDGMIENDAIHRISTNELRYDALRSAIGTSASGEVDIAWVSSRDDSVFAWSDAVQNQEGFPARMLPRSMSEYWPVEEAVAAGPVLVADGKVDVHIESEIFFDSLIPNIHPRTAAGVTSEGELLLMVVDGRQAASRGVNLEELAIMMRDIGAETAINLDGGGSSVMIAADSLLNRPVGVGNERPVATSLIIHCQN